jgi:hypothetical protein
VNEELQENKKTKMEKCLSICSVNEELQENKKKTKMENCMCICSVNEELQGNKNEELSVEIRIAIPFTN